MLPQSVHLSPESQMPKQISTARSFPRLPQTLPRFPLKSTTFLPVRQAPLWSHPRSCTLLFICLIIESPTATTCFFLSGLWSSPYFNFLWKKSVLGRMNVASRNFLFGEVALFWIGRGRPLLSLPLETRPESQVLLLNTHQALPVRAGSMQTELCCFAGTCWWEGLRPV